MDVHKEKLRLSLRRKKRVRAHIVGSLERPRLCARRSLRFLYAQIIDDANGKTLCSIDTRMITAKGTKTEQAYEAGLLIGKKAKKQGIARVVFDRGGCAYHGRTRAFADGARAGGLEF